MFEVESRYLDDDFGLARVILGGWRLKLCHHGRLCVIGTDCGWLEFKSGKLVVVFAGLGEVLVRGWLKWVIVGRF